MTLTSSFLQHFPTCSTKFTRPCSLTPTLITADDRHGLELIHLQRFSSDLKVSDARDFSGQLWFSKIKRKKFGPSNPQAASFIV